MIGTTVSHYRIVGLLGRGGMGVVYEAEDLRLDRRVALKVLPAGARGGAAARARLEREARAASRLDHPNVGTIYEIGETEGRALFIAMAYYEGETLRAMIDADPLAVEWAVDVARQVAQGLRCAHAAGVVHRDVKPSNVVVTGDGVAKVIDFGVAVMVGAETLTTGGDVSGSTPYMSPEQARGERPDARTDVWALGVVLYEMLAGRRPFEGAYAQAVLYQVAHEAPPDLRALRPDVPEDVAEVVERCLLKDPAERYADAGEVLKALDSSAQRPVTTRFPGGLMARWPWLVAVVGLIAVGLAAVEFWPRPDEAVSLYEADGPYLDQTAIAVLPFESVGGDGTFAYGMTYALIEMLGRVPALRLTAATSSFAFEGTTASADSVGRALDVAHLVEGTVRTTGDQLRISARLVDTESGLQEWSETYDRNVGDLFAVQEEIARAVAYQLRARVGSAALLGDRPSNIEAYELTLQARQIMEIQGFEGETTRALGLQMEAIARDSTYAPAWAGLALIYHALAEYHSDDPQGDFESARAAAERALELDPGESLAHRMLGQIAYSYDGDLAASQAHLERAVESNPSEAVARARLGFTHLFWGDEASALHMAASAAEIDPLNVEALMWAGVVFSGAGRFERAVELGRSGAALCEWCGYWLPQFLAAAGETEEAMDVAREHLKRNPSLQLQRKYLAYAYAQSGDRQAAERELDSSDYMNHIFRAAVETALGDPDAAFAVLDRAVATDEQFIEDIVVSPEFIPLRSDARWGPLVASIRAGAGGQ